MNQVMNRSAKPSVEIDVEAFNAQLEGLDAEGRLALLAKQFEGRLMATTSFGLQASVMLKLLKLMRALTTKMKSSSPFTVA